MNKLSIGIVIAIMYLTSACEQGVIIPEPTTETQVDIFMEGQVRQPGQSSFSDFSLALGYTSDEDGYLFWQTGVTERPMSRDPFGPYFTTLIMGAYLSDDGTGEALYGLQFWPNDATPDEPMPQAYVEDFFALGNTFAFGEGQGKVDVALRLPIGGPYDELRPSKSSFLNAPEGLLTITGKEDYTFTELSGATPVTITGKLIRCTLAGEIGFYNLSVDTSDGMPWYETHQVVELAGAECVFFVPYE